VHLVQNSPDQELKMASRQAMIEVIERAYEARNNGAIDALMAEFHPKAVFELKGDKSALSVVGRAEGEANVRAALGQLIGAFDFLQREIRETIVEGDRAIVHSRLKIKFVPSGQIFDTDVLDSIKFEDGKIVELVEFADTALIKDLVGK
jgi:ketosteroid isomerase-like protein